MSTTAHEELIEIACNGGVKLYGTESFMAKILTHPKVITAFEDMQLPNAEN